MCNRKPWLLSTGGTGGSHGSERTCDLSLCQNQCCFSGVVTVHKLARVLLFLHPGKEPGRCQCPTWDAVTHPSHNGHVNFPRMLFFGSQTIFETVMFPSLHPLLLCLGWCPLLTSKRVITCLLSIVCMWSQKTCDLFVAVRLSKSFTAYLYFTFLFIMFIKTIRKWLYSITTLTFQLGNS